MNKKFENTYKSTFFTGLILLLLLNRPFVGLDILGYKLGELLIVSSLTILVVVTILSLFNVTIFQIETRVYSKIIYVSLFLFVLSIFINKSNILASYTYKSSVYIWTVGYIFTGIIFSNFKSKEFGTIFFLPIIMSIPFVHYFFSTGYYPDFLINFFKTYSDKFEFTKASDIMLSLIVANIMSFKLIKKDSVKFIYFFTSVSILLPLLLLMSRGSFVSTALFFLLVIFYFLEYFIKNIKKSIIYLLTFFSFFVISTYNVSDVDFSFNLGLGEEAGTELSIVENVKNISKKNDTRKAFLSLYISDGRLKSKDNTTDWRLDIWQDVFYDMKEKNIIIQGYGHNEIIPVMTDPSAPGRLGRDGLNENVHNYFVNIFARGGVLQLIIFVAFYIALLKTWKKHNSDYSIVILLIPVLFNSTLDMSMEGVQYPLVFFAFLGYLYATEKDSKILNFTS